MTQPGHLRLIILECPYDSWNDAFLREMFDKTVALKLAGYQREYPYGALPLDTTDFIGTHHLLCEERAGSFDPVLAFRTISLERCNIHHVPFPLLSLMKTLGLHAHAGAISALIEKSRTTGRGLSYTSACAVREDHKGLPELRSILQAVHVAYHYNYKFTLGVSGGVLRFKMDQILSHIGYRPLSHEGVTLGTIDVPSVAANEPILLLASDAFSPEGLQLAERYRSIWENRITVFARNPAAQETRKAA